MDEHLKKYYLAHHGIPGQKWGQRHGPPYPLNSDVNRSIIFTGVGNFADAQAVIADKKSGEIKTVDIYSLRLKISK